MAEELTHHQGVAVDEFTDADVEALSEAPLLSELSSADTAAFRAHVRAMLLGRGDRLYAQGESGDSLYVVIAGKLKLTRRSTDGREVLVRVIGPGEMFGELAMFDPTYRTATATALTDSRLAMIAHDDLAAILADRPSVALLMLRVLAHRLSEVTDAATSLVFTDVPGRVARALLELADKFGEPQEDAILVAHDLTQEELAQLVGASRETVNKALADFAGRGWILLSAKSVLIIDPERLRRRVRLARLRQLAALSEIVQLSLHGKLGIRPERTVHVRVDPGHDLGRGAVTGSERCPHLGQSLRAVRYVIVHNSQRLGQ